MVSARSSARSSSCSAARRLGRLVAELGGAPGRRQAELAAKAPVAARAEPAAASAAASPPAPPDATRQDWRQDWQLGVRTAPGLRRTLFLPYNWFVASATALATALGPVFRGDCDLRLAFSSYPDGYCEGQKVWITGASSGIGAAIAQELSAKGAFIILSSRRLEKLEEVRLGLDAPDKAVRFHSLFTHFSLTRSLTFPEFPCTFYPLFAQVSIVLDLEKPVLSGLEHRVGEAFRNFTSNPACR